MIADKRSRLGRPIGLSNKGIAEAQSSMVKRDYLSHSQVNCYRTCPLKWWFTYVVQAKPEYLSGSLLFGASVHAAIQKHLEALIACDRSPNLDELIAAYEERWRIEAGDLPIRYGKGSDPESTTGTAKRLLTCFLASPLARPDGEILGIEESLRAPLGGDLPDLLARVDLIEYRDGEVVITDFKTSRCAWNANTADDHADQLILYGYAAQSIAADFKAKVRLRFIVLTKGKNPTTEQFVIPYEDDRMERCRIVIGQIHRCMQNEIVYPAPSPLNCCVCPYTEQCKAWHLGFCP